jgi:putative endonuclease
MTRNNKKRSYDFGLISEFIIKLYLTLKFYKILHSRYRSRFGEIDIIAKRGSTILFIEVKGRKKLPLNLEVVTQRQIERIKKTALFFIAKNPIYQQCNLRFDLIIPYRWGIKYIENAW